MLELNYRPIEYDKDIPEVTRLIKDNLNSKITQDFFIWKHFENPFGKSYGMLALDNEQIIGLRMFMFWKFFNPATEEYARAIRPVDTVTDVGYRGKGLFKKLTLQGLEECEGRYDVVFNTPNENSLPGYLKMGWKSLSRVGHFKIGVVNPFKQILNFEETENNSHIIISQEASNNTYATYKSKDFLSWRYRGEDFRIATFEESGCFIIYKTSKINGFLTIIIFEILGDKSLFTRMVRAVCRRNGIQFVYFYNCKEFQHVKFIRSFERVKPVVVYKEDRLNVFENFNFSLGDLEGKL